MDKWEMAALELAEKKTCLDRCGEEIPCIYPGCKIIKTLTEALRKSEEAVKPYLAVVEAAKVLETDIKQDECCGGEGCYDVGYLKDLRKALAALPQEPR
jgi:hypothetical protein